MAKKSHKRKFIWKESDLVITPKKKSSTNSKKK